MDRMDRILVPSLKKVMQINNIDRERNAVSVLQKMPLFQTILKCIRTENETILKT